VKLLKVTPILFVLGFFATLLVAFTIFPVNTNTTPAGTGIKAKPRIEKPCTEKPTNESTLSSDLFLVLWKDGGEIKGIFTSEEKAKKFIEVTQNESIYEIKIFNYAPDKNLKNDE